MKRKLFLLVALVGLCLSASAQKFALVDMSYIMSNIPAYERANEQLNQVSKKWQSEVEAIDNQAKTLYKNYQNEVMFLSEAQKKEREQAIVNKEKEASELKKKYFGPQGELYKKRGPRGTHPRRNLQCHQGHRTEQGIPTHPRPRFGDGRHHLCLPSHRYQQRSVD